MSQPLQVKTGNVHWQVLPECRDQLLGPDGLRLEEWLRTGQAAVVKHGPHRTVYRVALPGLQFFVKHYRVPDLRAWLRQLVRPSKARMEYRRALAVAGRQVPTVSPLALGEQHGGHRPGDSFLITRCLENTEPLNLFIEKTFPTFSPARQALIRRRLARKLGKLIARLHDAGIVHHDLHAANLLISLTPEDQPHLHVIDLHAVGLGPPLDWRASRANLILLNRWFILRVNRTDRARFWRAYCENRITPCLPGALLDDPSKRTALIAHDLERRTWRSNRQFWRSRDRRCLATNRYYSRVRGRVAAGYAVADVDTVALRGLLADPDDPFRRPGVSVLKDSGSSTVVEMDLPVGGKIQRVIYKRFRVTAWSDPWAALVRPSPALRSWISGHGLRERCLPTARPLAVFHRRRFGLSYEGYLITEKIPDARDLHRFLADLERLPAPQRQSLLRRSIEQVASLVRELHRRRLSHRDLKAANILVRREDAPSGRADNPGRGTLLPLSLNSQLCLIDLVGLTARHKLSRPRRVQNLARLNASFLQTTALTRTDRLRFLRAYLQWGLFGRSTWRRWWQLVALATQRKVARNIKTGRPLA
jgi:tRNA A-37 threonylcarbamoyl transferase component Bud32